nr:hypothetical protein [Tanacetum cinerariifolium]
MEGGDDGRERMSKWWSLSATFNSTENDPNQGVNGIKNMAASLMEEVNVCTPRLKIVYTYSEYTEEYHQLLDTDIGDKDNLLGLCLGPNSLFNDALKVPDTQAEPLLCKNPIVHFANTFSESARLLWIREDVNGAFESGSDIQIARRQSYIPDLAKKWGKVYATAERRKIKGKMCIDTTDSDPPEQTESDKRTHLGIDNLLTNSVYAVASVDFKTIVQDTQAEPLLWKKPIVRFAFAFSEFARLLRSYIPDLARKWGKICATAERRKIKGKMCIDTTDSDPPEQPESDKRTYLGIDNLLANSVYAVASVDFKTIVTGDEKAVGGKKVVKSTAKDHVFVYNARHKVKEILDMLTMELEMSRLLSMLARMEQQEHVQSMVLYASSCHSACMFEDYKFHVPSWM